MRDVHMVLSARALPYARLCLDTLLRQSVDPLRLRLITDSAEDAAALTAAVQGIAPPDSHQVSVHDQAEADRRADDQLRRYPNVLRFRQGHPCWRKITDPSLFATEGEEMVLLDPDLYFPNRFRFEQTPERGILLMWQRPNCLFPPETVRAAIAASYRLAHHVDIGVAHARCPIDWDWLERFLGAIGGGGDIPRIMHVEALVWSAMAMHVGGGYLDPSAWQCWHRTQLKRVLVKMRAPGPQLLRLEPFRRLKCFHAGGVAKNWIPDAHAAGYLEGGRTELVAPTSVRPFVELYPREYETEQLLKTMLRRVGYYRAFGSS